MRWQVFARLGGVLIGLIGLIGLTGSAHATMMGGDTVVVPRGEYATVVELDLGPGTYRVNTTDLKWFDTSLQALSFGVFGATGPISTKIGAGTLEFFNAAPGKVFLQLYANTGQSVAGALVAWQMESIAAVALPASIWLLLSALGSVGFWRWWSYRVWEFGTPAAT